MKSMSRRSVLQSGAAVAAGLAVATAAQGQVVNKEDKLDPNYDFSKAKGAESCRLLARTIAGTQAQPQVVGGFVSNTFILFVSGKKPYVNMTVRLIPVIYTHQPEYWRIEVVGCLPGIALPAVAPYIASLPLDQCRGTKGIEVAWDDQAVKIDVR